MNREDSLRVTAYPGPPSAPPVIYLRGLPARPGTAGPATRLLDRVLLCRVGRTHRVFAVGRPDEIRPGVDMAAIAGVYARGIARRFGRPVAVVGMSTGASLALQLAVDHPQTVERLVVVAGAGRLSDRGRDIQGRYAELLAAGDPAAALQFAAGSLDVSLAAPALRMATSLLPPARDTDGLLALLHAEQSFDVLDRVDAVTTPTLFVSGGRDIFYPPALARATAEPMRDAAHLVLPGRGHAAVALDPRTGTALARFLAP